MASLSFNELVDNAIYKSELLPAAEHLQRHPHQCRTYPHLIKRLLNELGRQEHREELKKCFLSLLNIGFIFDQKEYLLPIKSLICSDLSCVQICLRLISQLINNNVQLDTSVLQSLWNEAFHFATSNEELWQQIHEVNVQIMSDSNFYLSQEFVVDTIDKYMLVGKVKEAEELVLDPRVSVQHCPGIWPVYIERALREDKFMQVLFNIQKLETKFGSDLYPSLYNMVIERLIQTQSSLKHIFQQQLIQKQAFALGKLAQASSQTQGKCQVNKLLQIVDFLIERKITLKPQNQTEVLVQLYHLKERTVLVEYIERLSYCLDQHVFNFLLTILMEALDFEAVFLALSLAFDGKIKNVDLYRVDLSKGALKLLLKIQMQKNKDQAWEWLESDKSELASMMGSPESKQRIMEFSKSLMPDLEECEVKSLFQVVGDEDDYEKPSSMVELSSSYSQL